jgi:hypothetical protein
LLTLRLYSETAATRAVAYSLDGEFFAYAQGET